MHNELDSDSINSGLACRQLRKFIQIAMWKIVRDFPRLFLDYVEVVKQPLSIRSKRLAFANLGSRNLMDSDDRSGIVSVSLDESRIRFFYNDLKLFSELL